MNKSIKSRSIKNYLNYICNTGRGLLPRWFAISISIFIIIFCALKLKGLLSGMLYPDINGYGYTELLINFSGGFIRRGLVGDLIYLLTDLTGISPVYIIQGICLLALAFVIIYFCRRFYHLNLNWWIIASPLLCGTLAACIRKDWILYALLIGIFTLLKDANPPKGRIFGAILLSVFGLFIHEAFIFWGLPIVVLLLLVKKETRWWGIIGAFILIGVFGMMSIFKGTENQAIAIINSWKEMPGCDLIEYRKYNSIGALGWDLHKTISDNLYLNFSNKYPIWFVIPIRLIVMLLSYYMLSNFIFTFKKDNNNSPLSEKTSFSALLIFSFVCMVPMFTVLSCDWERLYQYVAISTFGTYITLSRESFINLFPKRILRGVAKFNSSLEKILKPTPLVMVILLFVLAISPAFFTPQVAIMRSILVTLLFWGKSILSILYHIFIP